MESSDGDRSAREQSSPTGNANPRSHRALTPYDVALCLILLVAWLGPITWVGATGQNIPAYPAWLRHQHRISCLFIHELKGAQTYHIEVQRGGSNTWEQLGKEGYFDLPAFGYRTRLHRLFVLSYRTGKGGLRILELGNFIHRRYYELNPDGPVLDAVRFVRVHASNEILERQCGRFEPMQPHEVPIEDVIYFGEMRSDGKPALHQGWGRPANPLPPPPRDRRRSRPPPQSGGQS